MFQETSTKNTARPTLCGTAQGAMDFNLIPEDRLVQVSFYPGTDENINY